jgi:hypothetical protein
MCEKVAVIAGNAGAKVALASTVIVLASNKKQVVSLE